jgi:hypothetical protein
MFDLETPGNLGRVITVDCFAFWKDNCPVPGVPDHFYVSAVICDADEFDIAA